MRMLTTLIMAFTICLISSQLFAQDDPFAGPDPFQQGAKAKPQQEKPNLNAPGPGQKTPAGAQAIPKRTNSQATERIRAALSDNTTLEMVEMPLGDAVKFVSQMHDIPVFLHTRALEEIGMSNDVPITIAVKNVTLRSALRLMLRDLSLTYTVKDEVLIVTTPEVAERFLVTEMYQFPEVLVPKSEKVLSALQAAVAPDAWDKLGGPCTATTIDNVLVISAPEMIHEDTIRFMQKLQEAYLRNQAKKQ